jgi:hypothetical protein
MVILFKTSFHTKSYHSIMSDAVESFSPLKFESTSEIHVVVVPMADGGEVISSLLWHPSRV